jgi:hypothetical protein
VTPAKAIVKTITKLTLDECPAVVLNPKSIEVAGRLTPALAGAQVSASFAPPKGSPNVVTATVDAEGSWKAAFTPKPSDTGTWNVDASYGGDSTHTASSAPTCTVDYQ